MDKLKGKALDRSYSSYVKQYNLYKKNGRMNSEMFSKTEYRDYHYSAKLMGDKNVSKNIPRALASNQRVVSQGQAKIYSKMLGYTTEQVKKIDWLGKYKKLYPDESTIITPKFGKTYSMTQAQALYFILKEAGHSDEEIYNE